MRMDLLSIFLDDFRGPRKMVFRLKIMRSKSAGNHGALHHKSTNFQGEIASLAFKMKRKNINRCFGGLRMEDQGEWSPQTFLEEKFFLPSTAAKTRRSLHFQVSFEYRSRI